jgi:hypothetical protein
LLDSEKDSVDYFFRLEVTMLSFGKKVKTWSSQLQLFLCHYPLPISRLSFFFGLEIDRFKPGHFADTWCESFHDW